MGSYRLNRMVVMLATGVALGCVSGGWEACAATNAVVQHPIAGRMWPDDVLRATYERIRTTYVADQTSRAIVPASSLLAGPLRGVVVDTASDRRVIIRGEQGLAAVQCRKILPVAIGEVVEVMVAPSGTPWYSYRTETRERVRMPQYIEVTLAYDAFVTSLQRGQHYPELPELGTREQRRGLFRTRRVEGNVVEDRR
jgi:hypothetical protein